MPDKTVDLFNVHQGLTGRDGGPYLDQVEAIEAEKRRAVVEGREPADLSKPELLPATAGTPLVTAGELSRMANPTSNPSMESTDGAVAALESAAKDKDNPLTVHSSRADILTAPESDEVASNPTVGSDEGNSTAKDKK